MTRSRARLYAVPGPPWPPEGLEEIGARLAEDIQLVTGCADRDRQVVTEALARIVANAVRGEILLVITRPPAA